MSRVSPLRYESDIASVRGHPTLADRSGCHLSSLYLGSLEKVVMNLPLRTDFQSPASHRGIGLSTIQVRVKSKSDGIDLPGPVKDGHPAFSGNVTSWSLTQSRPFRKRMLRNRSQISPPFLQFSQAGVFVSPIKLDI